MRADPKPFELYRHFKGNLYQIITIAADANDGSSKVVYQALYGSYQVYVRDLAEFMSETDREKYPDARQKYRFEKVELQEADMLRSSAELRSEPEEYGAAFAQEGSEAAAAQEQDQAAAQEQDQAADTLRQPPESGCLDPAVSEYLEASGYEERLRILTGVHHRITEEMLTTMAVASDIELEEGSVEELYQSLKNCLLTKQKFEKVRGF